MYRCLHCQHAFDAVSHTTPCPSCGTALATPVEGVPCYAPQLAYESPGFRPEHFARLSELEDGNFWFCTRNELIIQALRKCSPHSRNLLVICCDAGYVLHGVTQEISELQVSSNKFSWKDSRYPLDCGSRENSLNLATRV